MISKIKFRYSWIYDDRHRRRFEETGKEYPPVKKVVNYINPVEKMWRKKEIKILQEISKITRFNWQEKEVICYVVGKTRCFSDPLTLCLFEDKKGFIDTLTHEMIHQIQTQNQKKNKNWKEHIEKSYPNETRTTRNHILVHAIHHQIFLKLFNKRRLTREIQNTQKNPEYARSWEIVKEEGAENIIKKFREVTK